MLHVASQIEKDVAAIRDRWQGRPRVGIIFGSGLGGLADAIDAEAVIPYAEIPHFLAPTAAGHGGQMIGGKLEGVPVVALAGRSHCYEGHSAEAVALPVRVMKALGIEVLVVTNAAGAVNPEYQVGDLMVIDDHINLMFRNPLVGVNDDGLGPRFPDMSAPYDRQLVDAALDAARRRQITCHRGVYVGMLGPTYETRAEYRMIRKIGGDVAGMSTVPEVVAAVHAGLRVLGFSTVTNVFREAGAAATSHGDVLAAANSAGERLGQLIRDVLVSDF